MATREKFNLRQINYLLKNNFASTSTAKTLTSPTLQSILLIQPTSSSQGFGKELTNLIKIYIEDNKYSKEDDNFNFKFTIFHNLCSRANMP